MYNDWYIILYCYIFLTNGRNQLLNTFTFVVFGTVDPYCAIDKIFICDVLYTFLTTIMKKPTAYCYIHIPVQPHLMINNKPLC